MWVSHAHIHPRLNPSAPPQAVQPCASTSSLANFSVLASQRRNSRAATDSVFHLTCRSQPNARSWKPPAPLQSITQASPCSPNTQNSPASQHKPSTGLPTSALPLYPSILPRGVRGIAQIQQTHHVTPLLQILLTLSTVFGENPTLSPWSRTFPGSSSVQVSLLTSCLLSLTDEAPGFLQTLGCTEYTHPPSHLLALLPPPWSAQCLYFRLQEKHHSLPMGELDWAMGCPDIWLNIIPGISGTKS